VPGRSTLTARSWQWVSAVVVTGVLLGLLFSQINLQQLWSQYTKVPTWIWFAVVGCFALEGLLSTRRIQICAAAQTAFSAAFNVNGWYVALVLALPARMGEIGAVAILHRAAAMPLGAATLSIVFQRLLDVVCLLAVSLCLLFLATAERGTWLPAGGAVLCATLFALYKLERLLTCSAACLRRWVRSQRLTARLFVLLLQARRWLRTLSARRYAHAVALSLFKWAVTCTGITLLISALADIGTGPAMSATGLFSMTSAIPVHGLGGIGIGEYSLTAVLLAQQIPMSIAAGTALGVRAFIILFGMSFFLLTRLWSRPW